MSIEALKHQRRELQSRGTSLSDSVSRLMSLTDSVTRAQSALSDHDADAAEAMQAWATSGGEGEPPTGDHVARTSLLRDLARAQADVANAGQAHAHLTAEQREVAGSLAVVQGQIENHALNELEQEHRLAVEAFDRFVESDVRPKLARLFGLHAALVEMGRRHTNSGRDEHARTFYSRAERVASKRPLADVEASSGAIVAASSAWAQRFAELTSDPPASNVVKIGDAA